jgi:hypothetical protein
MANSEQVVEAYTWPTFAIRRGRAIRIITV